LCLCLAIAIAAVAVCGPACWSWSSRSRPHPIPAGRRRWSRWCRSLHAAAPSAAGPVPAPRSPAVAGARHEQPV